MAATFAVVGEFFAGGVAEAGAADLAAGGVAAAGADAGAAAMAGTSAAMGGAVAAAPATAGAAAMAGQGVAAGSGLLGGTVGTALATGLATSVGTQLVGSLLAPKTKAPSAGTAVAMPDPLAQQQAMQNSLLAQIARRGRSSTIMTDPGSGKLGG